MRGTFSAAISHHVKDYKPRLAHVKGSGAINTQAVDMLFTAPRCRRGWRDDIEPSRRERYAQDEGRPIAGY
jgi:hypothetical protein